MTSADRVEGGGGVLVGVRETPPGDIERGGGVLDRAWETPAGDTERGGWVIVRGCGAPIVIIGRGDGLLGRAGTSLNPTGCAELRIRVEVGGTELNGSVVFGHDLEGVLGRKSVVTRVPSAGVGF